MNHAPKQPPLQTFYLTLTYVNPHVDLLAGWSVDWLVGQLNGQLITKRQQSFNSSIFNIYIDAYH